MKALYWAKLQSIDSDNHENEITLPLRLCKEARKFLAPMHGKQNPALVSVKHAVQDLTPCLITLRVKLYNIGGGAVATQH